MSRRYQILITISPRVSENEIHEDILEFLRISKTIQDVEVISIPSPHTKDILISTLNRDSALIIKLTDFISQKNIPGTSIFFNF